MLITAFPAGPLQANCYVVGRGPGTDCVIVDPGMDAGDAIEQVVREHDLTPAAILLTHGHFDHMWSATPVSQRYEVPVWIHPADRHLLADPMAAISDESAELLRAQLGVAAATTFTEPADVRDAVGDIETAGLTFAAVHVPGHTAGTVMYAVAYDGPEEIPSVLFTGDFLFAGSIGRTDLSGGDHDAMTASLRSEVLPLADEVVILPGHGPQSSVGRERATNPFLAEVAEAAAGTRWRDE